MIVSRSKILKAILWSSISVSIPLTALIDDGDYKLVGLVTLIVLAVIAGWQDDDEPNVPRYRKRSKDKDRG